MVKKTDGIEENYGFIRLKPIGIVKNQNRKTSWESELQALNWQEKTTLMSEQRKAVSEIIINLEFEDMLTGTEGFSHLLVLYWAHLMPEEKRSVSIIHPLGDSRNFPPVGVFATHSPARPNGILVTAVRLLGRQGNILKVTGLDALDGSPVLDIKTYVPEPFAEEVKTPDWHKKMRQGIK